MNARRHQLTPETVRRLTIDPEPWLSCDDCFWLVDQYVELALEVGAAAGEQLPAMRAHLAGCAACREEALTLLSLAASDRGLGALEADAAERALGG
jgi:hypothetical protein